MIMVDIYVASVDAAYDFEMDEEITTGEALRQITGILGMLYHSEEDPERCPFLLCVSRDSRILPDGVSLREAGVENGDRLLLV